MKSLIQVLVAIGILSFNVSLVQAKVKSIDYNGEFRLKNEHKQLEHSSSDKHNTFQMRARLSLDFETESGLNFVFTPQATKNYGEIISSANDEDDSARNSSGDKYSSSVDIFETYVLGKKGEIQYKVGKQALVYGDKLVLGSRNWTAGGQTFDAIKLTYKKLDLVYSHISEGESGAESNDDTMLLFAYFKQINEKNNNLDFYLIYNNEKDELESTSLGFRYKRDFGFFDFRTENIAQSQVENESVEHYATMEFGFDLSDKSRIFFAASQTSDKYFQLYANRHSYNGMIDIIGRKNLEVYELGYSYKQSKKLKYGLKYLSFSQKTESVGAYNQSTSSILSGDAEEKNIGSEIDLSVNYGLNEEEKLTFGYSQFFYGDYFDKDTYGEDLENAHFTYLQYNLKF